MPSADDLRAEAHRRSDITGQFLAWLMPRLAGSVDDKETVIVAIMAHMQEEYARGIHDAQVIVSRVADHFPHSREAQALTVALHKLEVSSRQDPITSL